MTKKPAEVGLVLFHCEQEINASSDARIYSIAT